MEQQAAWHPDPHHRHELRYFDGTTWTDHVSDGGQTTLDPVGQSLQPSTGQNWAPPGAAGGGTAPPAAAYNALDMNKAEYRAQIPGAGDRFYSLLDLSQMAKQGALKANTLVQRTGDDFAVPASNLPGVFSDKSFTTAAILSFFLGAFGVDRFYLGYTGIGVAKLLTLGGCGIWSLVDFILVVTHKVPDSDGRPLA
jgi:hypothetical protein